MREYINIVESGDTITLYHGTCQSNAESLCTNGWEPNQVSAGANQGQARYLYLTSGIEDAAWFANEKGCSTVLSVTVSLRDLRVDPEDGVADTVEDELNNAHGLPGKVILVRRVGPEAFRVISGKITEATDDHPKFKPIMNPSDRQIARLLASSARTKLRGLFYEGSMWVWDANYAIHKDAARAIGVPYFPHGLDNRLEVIQQEGEVVIGFVEDEAATRFFRERFKNSDDIFFDFGSDGLLTGKEASNL